MAFHIVRLDVGDFTVDGVLDRVQIAQLPTAVNLVEMLDEIAIDDFL